MTRYTLNLDDGTDLDITDALAAAQITPGVNPAQITPGVNPGEIAARFTPEGRRALRIVATEDDGSGTFIFV